MIKLREYYSDVYDEEDENKKCQCNNCHNVFKAGDMLLEIPDKEVYDADEITEHCPFCMNIL